MSRVLRLSVGFLGSVWLHGGLFGLLLLVAPWLALLDPAQAPVPETEGPVAVSADFVVDGDLTATEDADPNPIEGGLTTEEAVAAEPKSADPTAPKRRDVPPGEQTVPAALAAARAGADQRQAQGPPHKPQKEPCPVVEEITQTSSASWKVQREFVDYYASHLSETMKLAGTWPHKGADGRPDGFRVGLPRCSVLRQGGLKSGDVVQDINGVHINNLLQAVAAWFELRNETHVVVNVARGGKKLSLLYQIERRDRRGKK
jgi:hypothetical protein